MYDRCVRALVVALVAVGLVAVAACSGPSDVKPSPTGVTAVKTALPGLVPPSGEPTLAALSHVHPASGAVATVPGPFDDRFKFAKLALNGAAVSGAVIVTSDVSAILELQVVAGFYDGSGHLICGGRFVYHSADDGHGDGGEGTPEEREAFSIAIPSQFRGRVASAALGVPVLVNE